MATEQFLLYVIQSIDLKAAIVSKASISKAAATEAAAAALVADPNVTVSQGMLKATSVGNYNDCCRQCAETAGCSYWQWIPARRGQ